MKRQRLSLLCALLLACTGCLAQTQKTDSVARAEIRKIKLSEDYLYADAMSGNGYAEAGTMAVEELRVQVATLLTEEQRDKDEVKRLVGGLEGLCESLRYSQMGMFKVFAYVSKKRVLGIDEPAPSAPVSAVPAAATDQPDIAPGTPAEEAFTVDGPDVAAADAPSVPARPVAGQTVSASPSTLSEPAAAEPVAEAPVVPVPPADTATVADAPSASVRPAAAEPVAEVPAVSSVPADTSTVASAPADDLELLPAADERVVTDLLALDTYESVMLYLDGMKEDGRLMYGRLSTLVSPQEAYLVIVKDGHLVTILDRGSGQRTNLRTRQPDNIQRYKGHAVIWMKVL